MENSQGVGGSRQPPARGGTCPACPGCCCPAPQAAAREGLQHSWRTTALTPCALFTRVRMQSGSADAERACAVWLFAGSFPGPETQGMGSC